jgi:hypothetical protein
MAKISNVIVITDAGGTQQLTIQNYAESDELEFFNTPFDEAIDGTLRSNFRDFRKKISLTYNLCTTPDTYRSICNNIVADLTSGKEFVYIGIDTNNVIRVVLDDGFASRVQYANQHGLFVPKINFTAFELGIDIALQFEDFRFINESSAGDQRDYRFIYETVTTQLDYGFIE